MGASRKPRLCCVSRRSKSMRTRDFVAYRGGTRQGGSAGNEASRWNARHQVLTSAKRHAEPASVIAAPTSSPGRCVQRAARDRRAPRDVPQARGRTSIQSVSGFSGKRLPRSDASANDADREQRQCKHHGAERHRRERRYADRRTGHDVGRYRAEGCHTLDRCTAAARNGIVPLQG